MSANDDDNFTQYQSQTLFVIISAISAACGVVVMSSALTFQSLRRRFFMHIFIMISFTDFVFSIFGILGFPRRDSLKCSLQGGFFNFFQRANWLWITMLACQLHAVTMTNRIKFSKRQMHAIVWSIALVLTLAPLGMGSFGRRAHLKMDQTCFIFSENNDWLLAWSFINFPITFTICLGIMAYYSMEIFETYRNLAENGKNAAIRVVVSTMYLYPVIMVVCWAPHIAFNVYQLFGAYHHQDVVLGYSQAWAVLQGVFNSIVFFIKCPEVFRLWGRYFNCRGTQTDSEDGDGRYLQDSDEDAHGHDWERGSSNSTTESSFVEQLSSNGVFRESFEVGRV